jgi:cytochrome c biogenesis protein CcmG/thiol:disulfide interchange protein DsbE
LKTSQDRGRPEWSAVALLAVPLLVVLLSGLAVVTSRVAIEPPAPSTAVGMTVPDFVLPPLAEQGPGLVTGDLHGIVSIVNFWASWCAPCREEMPFLLELAQASGSAVYGINSRDRPEAARRFLSEAGDPFRRIGVDVDGSLSAVWGIYGLPATFIVDSKGRVAHTIVGPLDRRIMDEEITPLLRRLRAAP